MLSLDFVSVEFIHLIVMLSQLRVEDLKYLTHLGDDSPDDADQIDISAQNDSPIATPTSAHALSSHPQTQQSKFSEDKVALFERRYCGNAPICTEW